MISAPFSGIMSMASQPAGYRFAFLGKQGLNRHANTGFGSLQRALREMYFAHLNLHTAAGGGGGGKGESAVDRASEKTLIFQESGINFRYWDSRARQFQQDFYPFEALTSVDLVHFHTVKGRKRRFGYFRRHCDAADVIPDTILIPLRRREYRQLRGMSHKPILCIVTRRPYGIQFLECQLFLTDSETEGLSFIEEFDVRSIAKRQQQQQQQQQQQHHHHQQPWRYNPWYDRNHWASQPTLVQAQTMVSDTSESAVITPNSTADSSRLLLMLHPLLTPKPKEALIERYRELQPLNLASEYSDDSDQLVPPPLPPRNRERLPLQATAQSFLSAPPPPTGGVRVLPSGPAPKPAAVLRHSNGLGYDLQSDLEDRHYGNAQRSNFTNGDRNDLAKSPQNDVANGGNRFTAVAHVRQVTRMQQQQQQQQLGKTSTNSTAQLEGINLDAEKGIGGVDFSTALGYLP